MRSQCFPFIIMLLAAMSFGPKDSDAEAPDTVFAVTEPRDGYPDVSPDGRRIVFQSNRTGNWQIWLVGTDGTGLRQLTRNDANDVTPVWSPDGKKILFASDRAGGAGKTSDPAESRTARDIFVMDFSKALNDHGASATRIVSGAEDEMHPEWAQRGQSIIFNRVYETDDGASIVIADAEGRNQTVVDTRDGWNTYAAMVPDGSQIVWRGLYEEMHDGKSVPNSDIYISLVDGRNLRRLTTSPAFDGWPAVSPDGRRVAFSSNRGANGYFHIYTMALDGSGLTPVTRGSYSYTQPAWSTDGKQLAAFRWLADDAGEIGHIVLLPAEAVNP